MAQKQDPLTYASTKMRPLPHLIFASRWLQLPLYLGLIVAQVIYVWQLWGEASYDEKTLLWQTVIHITFLLSALAIAAVDRLMPQGPGRAPVRVAADPAAH